MVTGPAVNFSVYIDGSICATILKVNKLRNNWYKPYSKNDVLKKSYATFNWIICDSIPSMKLRANHKINCKRQYS